MRTICNDCQGENILQQASIFIDLQEMRDNPDFQVEIGGLILDDYYHCVDCDQQVWVTEVE